MYKLFTTGIFLLLLSSFAEAQSKAVISGVVNNEEGLPVPYASISLFETNYGTSADEQGIFEIKGVPAGSYVIKVSAVGYQSSTRDIEVSERAVIKLSFRLPSGTTELGSVEVFGERDKQPEKLEVITRLPLKPSDQIQSISVISDKLIEMQGNLTISEAARNVPGVYTFATYGNVRESMSARGFRGIPILKNGVRINSDFRGIGVLTDMQGVESIQVLKGSAAVTQGIATDLGSPGGVINIVTKTPKFEQGGQVSLRLGSYGQVRPTFDIYGPINDAKTIAFRINGAYEYADSYRKGISYEKLYVNPSLEWRPDEKTSLVLEMDYMDDSRTPDPGTINLASNDINAIYHLPYDKFLGFKENRSSTKNATYAVRFNRELTDKLSFRAAFFTSNLDIDLVTTSLSSGGGRGAALPVLDNYSQRYRSIYSSTRIDNNSVLQLDLIGQKIQTGIFEHTFQLGIDFRNTYLETGGADMPPYHFVDVIDVFEPFTNNLPEEGMVYVPPVTDEEGNVLEPARFESAGVSLISNETIASKNKSYGIMAQDVIDITDWARVFLGVRFSSNESTGTASAAVSRDNVIDPQFGLMLSPMKGLNVFGSYTTSTSLRGAENVDVNGNELGNQRIDQLEAGIKSDWFHKRLRFNLTLYKINNKNMSMPVYDANWNETGYYQKGGNDERKGIETEIVGRILPNLEIVAGYAYIDAQYKEHASYYSGSAPLNTPSHTANGWLNYTLNQGLLTGLQVGLGAYYISERPINDWAKTVTHEGIVPGQKPFYVSSYTIVNAQLAYNKEKYGIRLLFNNIFDKIGYNAYRTSFINQTDPRSFAAIFSYRF